jgi:hypothetical protein
LGPWIIKVIIAWHCKLKVVSEGNRVAGALH